MAPVRLWDAMPAAVNGNELHFPGIVAPRHLLDANSVCHLGLFRFRRAGHVIEVRTIPG
jgi:hypothetical protein